MAENLTIARPYAQAVFASALEHKSVESWLKQLEALACACSDEVFMVALKNSSSPEAAVKTVLDLLKGLLDEYGENLVRIIGANGRFEVMPEIYQEFVRLNDEHNKVIKAQLISARRIGPLEIQALSDKLASKYDCKVQLETVIDTDLIGGAVLKIGDEVIDASVKTSLVELSSTLR